MVTKIDSQHLSYLERLKRCIRRYVYAQLLLKILITRPEYFNSGLIPEIDSEEVILVALGHAVYFSLSLMGNQKLGISRRVDIELFS
jgi:hypothetical protein